MSRQIGTLPHFADWLRGEIERNGDRKYNHRDGTACLGYQYIKAQGLPILVFGYFSWDDENRNVFDVDRRFYGIIRTLPHTLSAALERAEGYQ